MKSGTFFHILLSVGALVMGASLLLWYWDRKSGRPVRSRTHGLLTVIALLLMYPSGGGLFWDLLPSPSSFLALLMWPPLQAFLFICGLIMVVSAVLLYRSNRKNGEPISQCSYAIAIVIGLLLTWCYGYSLFLELFLPLFI